MPKTIQGSMTSLWRYPAKSMLGEELNAVKVTSRGLLSDRAFALVAADERRRPPRTRGSGRHSLGFRPPYPNRRAPGQLAAGPLTLPDRTIVTSHQADLNQVFSQALSRAVTPDPAGRSHAGPVNAEEYWPTWKGSSIGIPSPTSLSPRGRSLTPPRSSVDDRHARPAPPTLSARTLRGPALSSQRRRGASLGRDGLRRKCLGRRHARHRRFCSPECHSDPVSSVS